jgi:hypothetical protein
MTDPPAPSKSPEARCARKTCGHLQSEHHCQEHPRTPKGGYIPNPVGHVHDRLGSCADCGIVLVRGTEGYYKCPAFVPTPKSERGT